MRKFSILLGLIILVIPGFSQNKKNGEIGVSVGGSYYLGDLNKIPFINTSFSAGAFYRHNFNYRYSAQGTINYGRLKGNGTNLLDNPIQFSGPFYEASGTLQFNFKPYLPGEKKFKYTPFVFAGLSIVYYQIGQNLWSAAIPFGVGFKVHFNDQFSWGVTYEMDKTFTDYVDYRYSNSFVGSTHLGQESYAGNKDWFSVFGINLAYKINYRMKCPAFD